MNKYSVPYITFVRWHC